MKLYYLESINTEEKIFETGVFCENQIKNEGKKYLEKNYNDELWLYKKCNDKKTVGDDFILTLVFRNKNLCKEIIKGHRTFYKKLT